MTGMFPAKLPLAHSSAGAIYTDGSCIKDPDDGKTVAIGAACFVGWTGESHLVDPGGHKSTFTINRAELSAINYALDLARDKESVSIFTDSLCSLYLIRKALRAPRAIRFNKHMPLLSAIADKIKARCRSGLGTHLLKVKAHTGVTGNEAADAAAKRAADGAPCDHTERADPNHLDRLVWAGTSTEEGEPYYAGNLTQALKKLAAPKAATGLSNRTLYTSLWDAAKADIHPPCSNHMWHAEDMAFQDVRTVFKYRWGALYNQKIAMRIGRSHTSACPLCAGQDSGSHIMGGCEHAAMRALYVTRHDAAVKLVQRAVSKGEKGGFFTVMDAGRAADLPDTVTSKRLPPWLLGRHQMAPRGGVEHYRPDILILEGVTPSEARRWAAQGYAPVHRKRSTTVHVVEVGYADDLRYQEKMVQKTAQHAELAALLKQARWGNVLISPPIVVGHGGTIYADSVAALCNMGVPKQAAVKTLHKVHTHTVRSAGAIVRTRRMLEKNGGHG